MTVFVLVQGSLLCNTWFFVAIQIYEWDKFSVMLWLACLSFQHCSSGVVQHKANSTSTCLTRHRCCSCRCYANLHLGVALVNALHKISEIFYSVNRMSLKLKRWKWYQIFRCTVHSLLRASAMVVLWHFVLHIKRFKGTQWKTTQSDGLSTNKETKMRWQTLCGDLPAVPTVMQHKRLHSPTSVH